MIVTLKQWLLLFITAGLMAATGCQTAVAPTPTLLAIEVTAAPMESAEPSPTVPATWTPRPTEVSLHPSPAPFQTKVRPSVTPWPTAAATEPAAAASATSEPTAVPASETPTPVPLTPTATPPLAASGNLLPNPSFEAGWYHINGVPELQVAEGWQLEWDEGANPLDGDPWNQFVRPESRVLTTDFLPAHEHALFIWDGRQTVKIFKGEGALSFRLMTSVFLEPGTYQFDVRLFPDLVVGYTESGAKIWAPDPLSGELRFIVADAGSSWIYPTFGQRNDYSYIFVVSEPGMVRLGLAIRGRWAIENNGWFFDDWSLVRLATP